MSITPRWLFAPLQSVCDMEDVYAFMWYSMLRRIDNVDLISLRLKYNALKSVFNIMAIG